MSSENSDKGHYQCVHPNLMTELEEKEKEETIMRKKTEK